MTEKNSTGNLTPKFIIALSLIILIALALTGLNYYKKYFAGNVDQDKYLYIRTGSEFTSVVDSVKQKRLVKDTASFREAAVNMNYPGKVKPGRYKLAKGMSNRAIVNMLKAGNQEPVKLRYQNLRLKQEFAKYVSKQIEADSTSIIHLLNSENFVSKYGFNTENVYTMFLPNSYEMYWNTSADKFFKRMYDEYQKFWTSERKAKAQALGLTPVQVSILAAIVDSEALHNDEMPTIAGLYLNRYKNGQRLQADPTVIFANNDFTIRRVLSKHLRTQSPYNTYLNAGLPPGPIMMPSTSAIDAVLNHEKHNYIYMCAKEDFSGYHNFAVNEAEHRVNARKFQAALNQRNIKK